MTAEPLPPRRAARDAYHARLMQLTAHVGVVGLMLPLAAYGLMAVALVALLLPMAQVRRELPVAVARGASR